MDAETDHYAPELTLDNSVIEPPGSYESGYHLTTDLVDQSIKFLAGHAAERPGKPWLLWLALGATHAPHQAPRDIIIPYEDVFAGGWDMERERRLARQLEMGIVPPHTRLPPRNDGVKPWAEHTADECRFFLRLQSAFAGMLDHADRQLARLVAFLERTGLRENTIVLVLSDNGASQEGGLLGGVTLGPRNLRAELWPEKLARLEDIGGPKVHNNFPHGWAMASNTPLRRYKQNTHGGGIRDPGRAAPSVRARLRHPADAARRNRHRAAGGDRRRAADAARRRELQGQPSRRDGALEGVTSVLRAVRTPRPLAPGLEGRRISSAGRDVRG
jgi:arylsulfatase